MEIQLTDEEPALAQSLSLGDLKRAIWRARAFILIAVTVCEVLAVFYLVVTPARYPTEMLLAPEQGGSGQPSGGGASGSMGGVGAAASLLGIGNINVNSDFAKFRVLYTSSQTAAVLDQRFHLLRRNFPGWDDRDHRWEMPPLTAGNALPRFVRWAFGRPIWRRPTPDDLATTLENQFTLTKRETDAFLTVSTESRDPQYSEKLMLALVDSANEILRARAQQQAAAQISYLSHELETVSNAEHHQALTQLLLGQEQSLMLSRSNLPYAAQILTPPITHYDQGKPGITLTLAVGLFVGLFVGIFIAFFREASARSRHEVARDSVEVIRMLAGRKSGRLHF